ncbi:MAG: hypothetical protein R6U65_12735, partial [Perlabentimonas sp.]
FAYFIIKDKVRLNLGFSKIMGHAIMGMLTKRILLTGQSIIVFKLGVSLHKTGAEYFNKKNGQK